MEDIEARYDILQADLATDNLEYIRLNAIVEETVHRHANIPKGWYKPLERHWQHSKAQQTPQPEQEETRSSSKRE